MDSETLLAEMRTLTTRLADLEREMQALRPTTEPETARAPSAIQDEAHRPADDGAPAVVDRRRLLSRGGAAAVGAALGGVAATIAAAGPAAAATGSFDSSDATPALTATNSSFGPAIQATSSAGSAIKITGTGGVAIEAASTNSSTIKASSTGGRVLEISSTSVAPAVAITQQEGIAAVAVDAAGVSIGIYSEGRDFGIYGESAAANGNGTAGRSIGGYAGVAGQGEDGAYGAAGYAMDGVGVLALGTDAQLALRERSGGTAPIMVPPRGRDDAHVAGEIYFDDDESLWVCVADGTPGTWVRLAGANTAGAFTALSTPVRVYDNRPGSGKPGAGTGPISGTRHGIDLTANSSGLPTDASAAMVTMTVTNTQANPAAYGQIYPDALATPPATSVINWTAANTVIATTTTTGLTNGKVAVTIAPGANVILDLIGYWR